MRYTHNGECSAGDLFDWLAVQFAKAELKAQSLGTLLGDQQVNRRRMAVGERQ